MTLKETREYIAATITAALEDVMIHAYQPKGIKAFHGWVEFDEIGYPADHEIPYGEIGLTATVNVLVATDRPTFERLSDDMTPDLIAACRAVGRGVVVRLYTETVGSTAFYMLSATFQTESEAA